jgi:hypothetical protein
MRFPDRGDVPELVRGRAFTIVEAAHLGPQDEAAELLAPLRALRPELDTFSAVPPSALGHLHMEPEHPEARLADDGLGRRAARPGDRRPGRRRRAGLAVAAGDRRAAPRERRAGDAPARVLHARRGHARRHRRGGGDRGAAGAPRGRAGALRRGLARPLARLTDRCRRLGVPSTMAPAPARPCRAPRAGDDAGVAGGELRCARRRSHSLPTGCHPSRRPPIARRSESSGERLARRSSGQRRSRRRIGSARLASGCSPVIRSRYV